MAGKTDTTVKKFRSKWFRVAIEGATTDGRNIDRQWIEEMATTYDRAKYGARVWMEHIRGVLPDSPFRAYGDVLALKAEDVQIDGKTVRGLYAQIEPTDDLVTMVNKLKQKIFTSIEVREKFAATGKAYFMGLGVTDTPASLGTEMLTFAAKNPDASPLKARKQDASDLFTACEEVEIEFEEIIDEPSKADGLFTRVMGILGKVKDKSVKDDAQFSELTDAVEALATHAKEQGESFNAQDAAQQDLRTKYQSLSTAHEQLATEFSDLRKQLGKTQDFRQQQRPPATGGNDQQVTDC